MKPVALFVAFLILLAGCSSIRDVPRSEIQTDSTFDNVRVATLDGFEYRFVRADVLPDTLVGYYSVTLERTNERKEIWFEDVLRRHKIPLNRVAKIELVRKDPVKTAFYGMSMLAAGYVLVTFVEGEAGDPGSSGPGGKGGIIVQ
jgi:hypothetical protein